MWQHASKSWSDLTWLLGFWSSSLLKRIRAYAKYTNWFTAWIKELYCKLHFSLISWVVSIIPCAVMYTTHTPYVNSSSTLPTRVKTTQTFLIYNRLTLTDLIPNHSKLTFLIEELLLSRLENFTVEGWSSQVSFSANKHDGVLWNTFLLLFFFSFVFFFHFKNNKMKFIIRRIFIITGSHLLHKLIMKINILLKIIKNYFIINIFHKLLMI